MALNPPLAGERAKPVTSHAPSDMRILLVSIDSLRRDLLGVYRDEPTGFGYTVDTPNLDRFADRAAVFDAHYAGSLPCMPARREWLTGVQEFLWRSWGPIEPFDAPLPRVFRQNGIPAALVTDHYHYFQHGSDGYYEDFNAFEFIRGHEWDAHRTTPKEPADADFLEQIHASDPHTLEWWNRIAYARNVADLEDEADFFAPRVMSAAAEWIRRNQAWDDWFCYVDSFDVHEPFHVPEPYASMYTDEDPADPDLPLWPIYGRVDADGVEESSMVAHGSAALSPRQVDFVRSQFAGKATMVDAWFGRVLDTLDEEGLWDDTMVVVTSDHGHYLGDHGWMGKPYAPLYDVLAHTPLMVWHPESPRMGETVEALTAAVDLYATLLEAGGIDGPGTTHSRSLMPLLRGETETHREWALYGYWGSSVNVTDGRYTYLHPTRDDGELYCYSTSMMNHYGSQFDPMTPKTDAEGGRYLPYTDTPVWRWPAEPHRRHDEPMLFDTRADPDQTRDLVGTDPDTTDRMRGLLTAGLEALEAPPEVGDRLGVQGGRSR